VALGASGVDSKGGQVQAGRPTLGLLEQLPCVGLAEVDADPGSAVRRHTGVIAALMLQVSAVGVVGSGLHGPEV
jgi:hypothetical protein